MEHFFRIAFWIVTLAVFCLNIQGKPLSKRSLSGAISELNADYFKNVICMEDSTFYAPTNIEKECFITALACVTSELERTNASEECTDPQKRINLGLDALDHIIKRLNPENSTRDNSSKCNCHLWPQKNFGNFVKGIESLLQQINTESVK